ncbi:MAG: hypothetical protein U5N58_06590 [Actinomycetota bacterium]|nr:hypothetical protein [Actinomycetota bacterium]
MAINTGKKALEIKWNVRDALMSIVVMIALLLGIYYATAKVLEMLSGIEFLSITSINNLSFSVLYGIQVFLMLGVVWFFAIYWRKSTPGDLGLRYYSIFKTLWYTFLALIAIFTP